MPLKYTKIEKFVIYNLLFEFFQTVLDTKCGCYDTQRLDLFIFVLISKKLILVS